MKTCEHFEFLTKVTVIFDDTIGMKCPLCKVGNMVRNALDCINGRSYDYAITNKKAKEWLEEVIE